MPKGYTSLGTLLMTPRCGQFIFFVRKKFLRGYHTIFWQFQDVVCDSGHAMNASFHYPIQLFSGWFESGWWFFYLKLDQKWIHHFLHNFRARNEIAPLRQRLNAGLQSNTPIWGLVQIQVVGFFNLNVPEMNYDSPCIVRNWLLATTVLCRTTV